MTKSVPANWGKIADPDPDRAGLYLLVEWLDPADESKGSRLVASHLSAAEVDIIIEALHYLYKPRGVAL